MSSAEVDPRPKRGRPRKATGDAAKPARGLDHILGQRISAARDERGFTQQRLAAALGVTFQQVQKYENGTNRISASSLWLVATALGLDIGHFFRGVAQPNARDGRPIDGTALRPGLGEAPAALSPNQKQAASAREVNELLQAFHRIENRTSRQTLIAVIKDVAR